MFRLIPFVLISTMFIWTIEALYFPNAAVVTRRDVGRQLSLNLSGTFYAFAAYDYDDIYDDSYSQRVRVVTSTLSSTVFNLSSQVNGTGQLVPVTFTSPITIINDNNSTSLNETDYVLYFVRSNVTPAFPVYSLQNGSIAVTADLNAHGVTILNAKPSVIASTFALKMVPTVRVASCGYDSATNDDYAVLDITSQRQSFSFHILNGPIATFYDPKASNVSFSFALNEATTLDRKVPSGAEFTITSAGFATVNSSYNVDRGLTMRQNYDFGKDTLTQIVIDATDFRDREMIRFIASGSKKSLDVSLNSTDTMYEPDVSASTLALTVTADDLNHAPRFRIKIISGATSTLEYTTSSLIILTLYILNTPPFD